MDANALRLGRSEVDLGKTMKFAHRPLTEQGNLSDIYLNYLGSPLSPALDMLSERKRPWPSVPPRG